MEEESALYGCVGDKCNITIELYKGGTGKNSFNNETRTIEPGGSTLTWEIVDDVINVTDSFNNDTIGFIYKSENDTLVTVDGKQTHIRK